MILNSDKPFQNALQFQSSSLFYISRHGGLGEKLKYNDYLEKNQ